MMHKILPIYKKLSKPVADLSIIAANYNNASYLHAFINSVAESGMQPMELIIVDDGSTDHSREILDRFRHLSYLRTIYFEANKGFTTALNTALEAATGKFIMRADPDDLLNPDRIGRQIEYLEDHPETDMLGSNAIYFNSSGGKHINVSNFPLRHESIVRAYQKGEHGLLHATVCGKREIYQRYRYQDLSPGEDYELFARMVKDGCTFANLSEPLYLVRVHGESSTSNISREAIALTFRFRDEIFGTSTGKARIWLYYNFIRFYRNYQLSESVFSKYGNLLLAILCHPSKLFKRFFRYK